MGLSPFLRTVSKPALAQAHNYRLRRITLPGALLMGWLALLVGCAAPLISHPMASSVDKAVDEAAADKSFPSAAEAGLAGAIVTAES